MRKIFFTLVLFCSVSFIGCGASKMHVEKVTDAVTGVTKIAVADNTTLTSLATALLESGQIDESTTEGQALATKLRAVNVQTAENRTNLRVLGYALQEALMSMTSISAEERAGYVTDLATILGSMTKD